MPCPSSLAMEEGGYRKERARSHAHARAHAFVCKYQPRSSYLCLLPRGRSYNQGAHGCLRCSYCVGTQAVGVAGGREGAASSGVDRSACLPSCSCGLEMEVQMSLWRLSYMSEAGEDLFSCLLAQQTPWRSKTEMLKQMSPVLECRWPSPPTQFFWGSVPMNPSS